LTYYLVEAPMQRIGRRVAARLDARFGSDCPEAARAPASWLPHATGQRLPVPAVRRLPVTVWPVLMSSERHRG
jgi:hypothetical protein